ncbi:major facilitator superfamily MFS_1 [Chthoniobacter flavus Ellin428]|uniref:Major facilitator superfamily MFS_1 n=1 Tax=Chthoniobacter flavus Ellin428 TaxID=497964 RepID=B4CUT8_9BACT|nr:MFS transporter [Chthoniobacter flavus]EDY22326.1 major facilitator superfamily MFS_1 [Chthoniobacter flavus Ellin428]TCO94660.1 cyanate permease [Chthoniobacter flavus]
MSSAHPTDLIAESVSPGSASPRRSLLGACLAHILHDGYTDLLYPLLPVWQVQFGLSYTGLAIVRALYFGTMGGLQVPCDRFIKRLSLRTTLAVATFVAALGFLVVALPFGFVGLCSGLVLAGLGSSVQHPRASLLVANAYGRTARGPLGIYNFAGDLGKATLPATVALLLPVMAWRPAVGLMALVGFAAGFALLALVPRQPFIAVAETKSTAQGSDRRGFGLLMSISVLDTATRMGYLLFLPFLIQGRGGSSATVGLGLALLFIGGALGKAVCGWLGQHLGVVGSVIVTEAATALLIVLTLFTPLTAMLILLPLLGIVLNGTSSVLYGTVPELAPGGDTARAFAVFYTGVIGSGALAPIIYGAVADHFNQTLGILTAGGTAALTIPLVLTLRSTLSR